jgi:hypothetical protein
MKRPPLTVLIPSLLFGAVAMYGGSTARAQTTITPVEAGSGIVCLNDLEIVLATVTVRRTEATRLSLDVGRDASCGYNVSLSDPKTFGPWRLSITEVDSQGATIPGTEADYINKADCPALEPYTIQLREPDLKKRHARASANVEVGAMVIEDADGIFGLGNEPDRQSIATWLHQTLAAVRGCWNTGNPSIPAHFFADRFDAILGD